MTKTLALAALVAGGLLAGTALQAQDASINSTPKHSERGGHARPNMERISKELKLTDDQQTKFKAALEDQQTKLKALREDTSLSKEDKRAKAKEIREQTQTTIKGILSLEQREKLRKMMEHRRGEAKKKAAASESSN